MTTRLLVVVLGLLLAGLIVLVLVQDRRPPPAPRNLRIVPQNHINSPRLFGVQFLLDTFRQTVVR
jgi:hypothetical protein